MPATPHHDTDVVGGAWDAGAETGKIPSNASASTLSQMYAWKDPQGDPTNKGSYKLPHHKGGATIGPAVASGVRAALSRVGQEKTQIPDSDVSAVRGNLLKHLAKYNKKSETSSEDISLLLQPSDDIARATMLIQTAGKAWAVTEALVEALDTLDGKILTNQLVDELTFSARMNGTKAVGAVSVVPLKGIITPGASLFAMLMGGGGGLDKFLTDFRSAVQDPDTKAVVLDVDSPGGLVDMVPETAAAMREIRDSSDKPVVAVANPLAASAAYWLAAQAHEVVVTPSGEAGSIGVYQIHRDASGFQERMGVKHTIVSAGKYKAEGNPYEALGDEGLAALQTAVNDYYGMFTADVAKGRGVSQQEVMDGYGEGRTLTAKRAKNAGLVDRVATLNETISRLGTGRAKVARIEPRTAADWTREDRLRLLDMLAG